MTQRVFEEDLMSSLNRPRDHSAEACLALRELARTTRRIDDPAEIYSILGALSDGLASLTQALHQVAAFHDDPGGHSAVVDGDVRHGRAASYQAAWELHRAAEMLTQVATGIDRAHEIEATIAYDVHPAAPLRSIARPAGHSGLSL
jgi:hypothetical protein